MRVFLRRMVMEFGRKAVRKLPVFSCEKRFRFQEIEAGKCFRSSLPTVRALDYFRKTHGIESLVIILREAERGELAYALKNEMKVHHIVLSHRSPTEREVGDFLAFIRNPSNQPALIHCYSGKDRTGCFALLYRVECMGWDIEKAWEEMRDLGHCVLPWEPTRSSQFKDWLEQRYGKTLGK